VRHLKLQLRLCSRTAYGKLSLPARSKLSPNSIRDCLATSSVELHFDACACTHHRLNKKTALTLLKNSSVQIVPTSYRSPSRSRLQDSHHLKQRDGRLAVFSQGIQRPQWRAQKSDLPFLLRKRAHADCCARQLHRATDKPRQHQIRLGSLFQYNHQPLPCFTTDQCRSSLALLRRLLPESPLLAQLATVHLVFLARA
jgi:hypothetical protein